MYNNIIYYNNTYCRRASVNDNIAEDDGRVIYRRLRPTSVYTLLCILYTVVVEYIQRLHGRYVTYVCARNTCKEFFLFVKKKNDLYNVVYVLQVVGKKKILYTARRMYSTRRRLLHYKILMYVVRVLQCLRMTFS